MSRDYPIQLLKQMLEIYSPSGREEGLATFLRGQLRKLGFKSVRLDGVGNLFGEMGSGSPTILLCGHMDTVPGRRPVKIEDKKIYGRGAVDAKSSLAAMIVASSKLGAKAVEGRVVVAGVVDEEGRGRGIRQMLRDKWEVDYAIFGEPSGVNNITIGYKGRLEIKIVCKTEGGHSSAPQAYNNAIEKTYGLWNEIKMWASEGIKQPPSLYYSTTACLTGLRGGGASNVVPGRCTLNVDVRLPPSLPCRRAVDQLNTVIRQYQEETPGIRLKMTVEDQIEPFIAQKKSPLVKALTQAIKDTVGGPVRLLRKTGTGDMSVFATGVKVPMVTYGPGNGRLSHTINEYIEIEEYLASIEVYQKAVAKLLTTKKQT